MANIKEQAAAVNMLPNARLTAAQVINSVFKDGAYANIALGKALSKQNHSEQDRRFVTELVYGTVKAKGTIDWLLQQLVSRPLGKIEPKILNIYGWVFSKFIFWNAYRPLLLVTSPLIWRRSSGMKAS